MNFLCGAQSVNRGRSRKVKRKTNRFFILNGLATTKETTGRRTLQRLTTKRATWETTKRATVETTKSDDWVEQRRFAVEGDDGRAWTTAERCRREGRGGGGAERLPMRATQK